MNGIALEKIREPWNDWTKRSFALDVIENDIKLNLKKVREGFIGIGFCLLEIDEKELWNTASDCHSDKYCNSITQWALNYFEFSPTYTRNLMSLAKLFGDAENKSVKQEFKYYSFSQLVEISSMPPESWEYFNFNMSVKDMRKLKQGHSVNYRNIDGVFTGANIKQLPAEFVQNPTSDFSNELDNTIEVPATVVNDFKKSLIEPVATSQQDESEAHQAKAAEPAEKASSKYERFDRFSRQELCERIDALEDECNVYLIKNAELENKIWALEKELERLQIEACAANVKIAS